MPRFVTKDMHAYLDYPVALGLIAAPFLLSLGASNPMAKQLSLLFGVAALVLTLLTDHKLGVFRVLPYKFHLAVDFVVGIIFVAAALLLGFKGIDMIFYLVVGITVLFVVCLHKPEPTQSMPSSA